jgi:hypothetical protein
MIASRTETKEMSKDDRSDDAYHFGALEQRVDEQQGISPPGACRLKRIILYPELVPIRLLTESWVPNARRAHDGISVIIETLADAIHPREQQDSGSPWGRSR